ncbi:MAG: hypothetical protein WCX48_01320 [Bacteroidales bacterium]
MNLKTLSRLLKELILTNDRVSLPGMGSFIAELAPSVFSDRAMVIHPPFRRLLFRTSEIWNDELLENLYAREMQIDLDIAKEKIASFLKEFKDELNTKKSISIPDFGTMRATDQKDYFFVAEKDLFIYRDAYGLEPINVKILTRPGSVERLNYKESTPLSSGSKRIIATITVIFTVIAIIVLMVIFKDEIRPVWEWLLYNKEERELLKLL